MDGKNRDVWQTIEATPTYFNHHYPYLNVTHINMHKLHKLGDKK
jgi:hypothetical protein